MAKRKSDADEEDPYTKRQRLTEQTVPQDQPHNIVNVADLQSLLTFEQDAGPKVRQKFLAFKSFLDSIAYGEENDERSARKAILLKYLQNQTSQGGEFTPECLTHVLKTWQFACQVNVESLYSSVTAVLALLLKTISSMIEVQEFGNQLCKLLLQGDQLQLLDKGLSANKTKEHLISPCLRLLTEIVSFDGGHSAQAVFRNRETTFKNLEIFLTLRKDTHGKETTKYQKPSIRNNALRYLYANLRLQSVSVKIHILTQRRIAHALFEGLSADPANVLFELLDTLKKDLILDNSLPQHNKIRFFSERILSRLAFLYHYDANEKSSEEHGSVQDKIHSFLLFLCADPRHGLLAVFEQDYPHFHEAESDALVTADIGHSPLDVSSKKVQSSQKTMQLACFLQTLKPHANLLHRELLLAVFREAPYMVADYFARKKSFSFEPKPTSTWIGYASFLLATIRLPLPEPLFDVSAQLSPDSIIDCLLPSPLTQKILTRCLNQSNHLVKYLSVSMLIAAFEKVEKVFEVCKQTNNRIPKESDAGMRKQFQAKLIVLFCSRAPDIESIVTQFRSCSRNHTFLHEGIIHLLALYHITLPQLALEARLDISLPLSTMLGEEAEKCSLEHLELGHMLQIAHRSPTMQWWHKSEKMHLSPFTALLKLHIDRLSDDQSQQLTDLLAAVLRDGQFLRNDETMLSLFVMISSLRTNAERGPPKALFDFLDNCIIRFTRKPAYYYDRFSSMILSTSGDCEVGEPNIDLLFVTISEQWPFVKETTDAIAAREIAIWLIRYVELTNLRLRRSAATKSFEGEIKILEHIRNQIMADFDDEIFRSELSKSLKGPSGLGLDFDSFLSMNSGKHEQTVVEVPDIDMEHSEVFVDPVPSGPPQEPQDHLGLNRWAKEDIQDAITDGMIEELFLCLCSEHAEIRQQALGATARFMAKLEASGYKEWQQSYVIAGEVTETARDTSADGFLPYLVAVLAARLLIVIADPLHLLYEKANKFLHKGPQWDVAKLPSYWVDKIILKPPTYDETHYQEATWLLDALIEGLRTPSDFELYRGCNIFERLLSFSASPALPRYCFQKILDLLFRCSYVGGSLTMITRCGLISWIESHLAIDGHDGKTKARLRSLSRRICETSDGERVDKWSNETLRATIDAIT